jgi:hypothetical protein
MIGRLGLPAAGGVRYDSDVAPGPVSTGDPGAAAPPPTARPGGAPMARPTPAKFYVNSGIVSSRNDILNLLRPLVKQTVSYRYLRGRELVAHGTGWVERVVIDEPETSSYFTPVSICLNVDSFEHLEFETRPDQLIVYVLVEGDERIVLEFAPVGQAAEPEPEQLSFDTTGFVQMELLGPEADEGA